MFVMGAQTNTVDKKTKNIQSSGRRNVWLELKNGEAGVGDVMKSSVAKLKGFTNPFLAINVIIFREMRSQ